MTLERDIRAVLSDVDNTLVPNESLDMPSPRVTDALRRTAAVVPTGTMTARQPQITLALIRHLEMSGYSGMSNGAQVYDGKREQMVVERTIDPVAVVTIAQEFTKLGIPFWVQDDGVDHMIDAQGKDGELRKYLPLETYIPHKPFIIRWSAQDHAAQDTVARFIERDFPDLTSFPAHQYADGRVAMFIADKKTNKADAVREIAERSGIDPHYILGIGDGPNDIPFMEVCGKKVAMGNAIPQVKERADYVAPSMEEDGVADALEHFVLFERA